MVLDAPARLSGGGLLNPRATTSSHRRDALIGAAVALLVAGCATEGSDVPECAGGPTAGVAVVCTDYTATAVSLLDSEAREVLAPTLIHSGCIPPRVGIAVGGDVVLPTTGPSDGTLLLLDRYPNGVLTFVDPGSGDVLRQISASYEFPANPHDALFLDDGRLLITRYRRNIDSDDSLEAGDDVLLLDAGGEPASALAMGDADGFPGRPDRLLAVGDAIWVTLNHTDFLTYREGLIARIRVPAGGAPVLLDRIEPAGVVNCGGLAADSTAGGGGAYVVCSGTWRRDVDDYDPADSALLKLAADGSELGRLAGSDPRVGGAFVPAVLAGAEGLVHAVVYGHPDTGPDRVIAWRPETDTVEGVYEATGPYKISALGRAADGAVLVPDAGDPVGRLCRLEGGGADCMDPCAATGLKPRDLAGFGL